MTIEEVRHSQRKETRICDTLGPLIQQHRLVVTSRVIKQDYRMTEEDPEHGLQPITVLPGQSAHT